MSGLRLVLDHVRHPQGFVELPLGEVRERVKDLERRPSGDGGDLYFDKAGLVVVEVYPLPMRRIGYCRECGAEMSADGFHEQGGFCIGCRNMPARRVSDER